MLLNIFESIRYNLCMNFENTPSTLETPDGYTLIEIYTILKKIECVLGYSSTTLGYVSDDVYWTIFRQEDIGHYGDKFINELKSENNSDLKRLINRLADLISERYVGSALENALRELV